MCFGEKWKRNVDFKKATRSLSLSAHWSYMLHGPIKNCTNQGSNALHEYFFQVPRWNSRFFQVIPGRPKTLSMLSNHGLGCAAAENNSAWHTVPFSAWSAANSACIQPCHFSILNSTLLFHKILFLKPPIKSLGRILYICKIMKENLRIRYESSVLSRSTGRSTAYSCWISSNTQFTCACYRDYYF